MNKRINSPFYQCQLGWMVGGYNKFGQKTIISKNYNVGKEFSPYFELKFECTIIKIDSWDSKNANEGVFIEINGLL